MCRTDRARKKLSQGNIVSLSMKINVSDKTHLMKALTEIEQYFQNGAQVQPKILIVQSIARKIK